MNAEELLSRETARGNCYRLLAACYYLPEENVAGTLVDLEETVQGICLEAAGYISRMLDDIEEMDASEPLRVDYSKLFVGPYELLAPPYGSVYLEGGRRIMGDSTVDVRNRYGEAGLAISEGFKEAPDHIAAELEFMYYLVFKETEAMGNSDIEGAMDYLRRQRRFLEDHLAAWVPEFADRIEANAETVFYRNLARSTRAFVRADLDDILKVSMAELSFFAATTAVSWPQG